MAKRKKAAVAIGDEYTVNLIETHRAAPGAAVAYARKAADERHALLADDVRRFRHLSEIQRSVALRAVGGEQISRRMQVIEAIRELLPTFDDGYLVALLTEVSVDSRWIDMGSWGSLRGKLYGEPDWETRLRRRRSIAAAATRKRKREHAEPNTPAAGAARPKGRRSAHSNGKAEARPASA